MINDVSDPIPSTHNYDIIANCALHGPIGEENVRIPSQEVHRITWIHTHITLYKDTQQALTRDSEEYHRLTYSYTQQGCNGRSVKCWANFECESKTIKIPLTPLEKRSGDITVCIWCDKIPSS